MKNASINYSFIQETNMRSKLFTDGGLCFQINPSYLYQSIKFLFSLPISFTINKRFINRLFNAQKAHDEWSTFCQTKQVTKLQIFFQHTKEIKYDQFN